MSSDRSIEDQLDGYFNWLEHHLGEPAAPVVDEGRTPKRRAVFLAAASAVLLIAGVAGIAVVQRGGDEPVVDAPPMAGGWDAFPAPPLEPRWDPVSIGTGDGWFVWGGVAPDNTSPDGVESMFDGAYHDNTTGEWRILPEAPVAHESAQGWSAVWTGTEVVIVQGFDRPKIAAFDVASFSWRTVEVTAEADAAWARREGSYSRPHLEIIDGRVVLFGNGNPEEGDPATVLLLDPSTDTLTTTGPTPVSMNSLLGPIAASDDELFVVGGSRRNSDSSCPDEATLYRFDVATLSWSSTPLPESTMSPRLAAWTGDRLLVGGGSTCGTPEVPRRDAWALTPVTGVWERLDDLPVDHEYSQGDAVAVEGGVAVAGPNGSVLLFWPGEGAWSVLPSPIGPADLQLAAFGGRLAVWGAGISRPGPEDGTAWCCRPVPAAYAAAPAPPSGPAPAPPATVPERYAIRVGDGALAIAERLCVTLDELTAANRDNDDYWTFVEGAELAVPEPSIAGCTPHMEPPDVRVYVVGNGDTPAAVAARWCVTVEELGAVNAGLDAATRFLTTEGVAVPPASIEGCTPGAAPVTTSAAATPTTTAEPTTGYVVREGDNPARVAATLCVSTDELAAANSDNPAYTRFLLGDVLVAPPPSIVGCEPGDVPLPVYFQDDLDRLAGFERATADDPLLGDGIPVLPDLTPFGDVSGDVEGSVALTPSGNSFVVVVAGERPGTGTPWQLTLNVDRRSAGGGPVDPAFLGVPVDLGAVDAFIGSDAGPQCPATPEDGYNEVVYTWFEGEWTFSIGGSPLPGCESDSPFSVDAVGRIVTSLLSCSGFDAGAPACRPMFL